MTDSTSTLKKASDLAKHLLTTAEYLESFEVFSRAWDAARDADAAGGRRYDRDRYQEAASHARSAYVLRVTAGRSACPEDPS